MTDTEIPRHAPWARIQEGEVVHIDGQNRRQRGIRKVCKECEKPFTVAATNARNNPAVGTYCCGSCRSKAVNRKRWAKK